MLSTLAAFGLAGVMVGGSAAPPRTVPSTPTTAALLELEGLLGKIHRAWNPRVRTRLAQQAAPQQPRLESPLLWVLSSPLHQRVAEAVFLASELGIDRAHGALVTLATSGPEDLRAVAVTAAAGLVPWPRAELFGFFSSPDPRVRVAAVRLAGTLEEPALTELYALMGDPEPGVREALVAAIPARLPAAARAELLDLARTAEGPREECAIAVLGKIGFDAASEGLLTAKLDSRSRATRVAALAALTGKGSSLREPGPVWALASYRSSDPTEQALALHCLERTGSFVVDDLARQLPLIFHVLPRLFAARCLISAGDRRGAELLLEILQAEGEQHGDFDGVDPESILVAARRLLGDLSGTGSCAGIAAWRDWLLENRQLRPRKLGPPTALPD